MKNIKKKIIALVLTVVMVFGMAAPASAAGLSAEQELTMFHVFDKLIDILFDTLICVAENALFSADTLGMNAFPTVDEYNAQPKEYFYEGSDGKVTGSAWKLGYASESIIPTSWRTNADGKADENGMNFKGLHWFGGYFTSTVDKIYDDERIYISILSAGNDANKNGVEDVIILGAVDNIGIGNGNIRDVRKAVSEALCKKGLAPDDIVAFELNCTHAHSVAEALGMSLDSVFLVALYNHIFLRKERSIDPAMFKSLCENAAKAATTAYDNMESGTLCYGETENIDDYMKEYACNEVNEVFRDKLECGADCMKNFAFWYFEGESGAKTVIANAGFHPTFAGRNSGKLCGDVPHYIWEAMKEAGYQFMFLQGSQAAIGLSSAYTEEGKAWAEKNTLTYEDWVARYGKKYADKRYLENDKDGGEAAYFSMKATGYSFAHFIIDSLGEAKEVAPVYDIKMMETIIPLDYTVMYVAAESALFGYNTVKYPDSETGYAIITEIGYVQLGEDVVMLTLPGEVSPAITFGTSDKEELWQGAGSWTGEDWKYDSLEDYAKAKLGSDKRIIAMGICNDEIGYVMPDTDCAQNFLSKTLFASKDGVYGRADNEELMETSRNAGSALTAGFIELFK